MAKILDNVYIWVFLVKSESVLLLAFVKYMLYSHVLKALFFVLLEAKNTCLATKNCMISLANAFPILLLGNLWRILLSEIFGR